VGAGGIAGVVAGLAVAAHDGAHSVNRACRSFADCPGEGRATFAVAAHAALSVIHKFGWDERQFGVILKREARPFVRVGAACAAALTIETAGRGHFLRCLRAA